MLDCSTCDRRGVDIICMRQVNVGGLSTGAARPLTGELKTFVDSAANGLLCHVI